MTFSELKTPGGYTCGEVASALQKSIRRGLSDDALFWATELDLAGYPEYVWKRLKIVASEDVGLASPETSLLIHSLYSSWVDQRKKKDERHAPERLFIVHAVLALAAAPKSRMIDHALIAMYEAPRGGRSIPDFALDKHTARGRKLGRAWEHFWKEGAVLAGDVQLPDPYKAIARATRQDGAATGDLFDTSAEG